MKSCRCDHCDGIVRTRSLQVRIQREVLGTSRLQWLCDSCVLELSLMTTRISDVFSRLPDVDERDARLMASSGEIELSGVGRRRWDDLSLLFSRRRASCHLANEAGARLADRADNIYN